MSHDMRVKQISNTHAVTDSGYLIELRSKGRKRNGMIHKGAKTGDGKYRKRAGEYVHRQIWRAFNGDIPKGMCIHHVDGDGHNNSLGNLRCVTHAGNLRGYNKPTKGNVTSKYRGVHFVSQSQRWMGQVKKDYKNHRTSNYKSELVAAVMRDCLARDLGFPIDSMNFNGKVG
jgi:hypothetical protein